jgi:hypothetical protein
MLEFRYCEDPMEARRAEVVVGRKNTIWNLLALSKKHMVAIGGEVHRCGMPTIVIAASSERLVGPAMRPCFSCRGVKYERGSCSARTSGLRASPCTRQCWGGRRP